MKKIILVLVLLLVIVGCKEVPKEVPKTLSELQITACNTADEAGTCRTRLIDVAIVMPTECCEVLGKCCE